MPLAWSGSTTVWCVSLSRKAPRRRVEMNWSARGSLSERHPRFLQAPSSVDDRVSLFPLAGVVVSRPCRRVWSKWLFGRKCYVFVRILLALIFYVTLWKTNAIFSTVNKRWSRVLILHTHHSRVCQGRSSVSIECGQEDQITPSWNDYTIP